MARYLVQDFFRERPAATGAAGATVQYYDQDDNPIGSSTTSDADGKFNLLDEIYPGLGYYTATKGGITKRHEAASIGFIGTLSAADLVTLFDGSFSNGILTGIGSGFALSAGGGLNISVAPGGGVIDGHPFRFSVAKVIALAAADGSNPRIDRMVASLVPPGAAVGNPGAITIKKVDGTPAASPAAPALVATADEVQINLGTWTVAAGAGAPSSIVSETARSIPGIHTHVMADITDLAAALALKANLAAPTFTGPVTVNGEFLVDVDSQNSVIIRKADNTQMFRFDTINGTLNLFQGTDLVLLSDGSTVVLRLDGATGSIVAGGATISPTELATLDGVSGAIQTQIDGKSATGHTHTIAQSDVTGLVAALAAKAPSAGATLTGANITASAGLHHTGGTWGFNGNSVSGPQDDPIDVSTGTVDATWGSTEATVLNDLRQAHNELVQLLRDVGIVGA